MESSKDIQSNYNEEYVITKADIEKVKGELNKIYSEIIPQIKNYIDYQEIVVCEQSDSETLFLTDLMRGTITIEVIEKENIVVDDSKLQSILLKYKENNTMEISTRDKKEKLEHESKAIRLKFANDLSSVDLTLSLIQEKMNNLEAQIKSCIQDSESIKNEMKIFLEGNSMHSGFLTKEEFNTISKSWTQKTIYLTNNLIVPFVNKGQLTIDFNYDCKLKINRSINNKDSQINLLTTSNNLPLKNSSSVKEKKDVLNISTTVNHKLVDLDNNPHYELDSITTNSSSFNDFIKHAKPESLQQDIFNLIITSKDIVASVKYKILFQGKLLNAKNSNPVNNIFNKIASPDLTLEDIKNLILLALEIERVEFKKNNKSNKLHHQSVSSSRLPSLLDVRRYLQKENKSNNAGQHNLFLKRCINKVKNEVEIDFLDQKLDFPDDINKIFKLYESYLTYKKYFHILCEDIINDISKDIGIYYKTILNDLKENDIVEGNSYHQEIFNAIANLNKQLEVFKEKDKISVNQLQNMLGDSKKDLSIAVAKLSKHWIDNINDIKNILPSKSRFNKNN